MVTFQSDVTLIPFRCDLDMWSKTWLLTFTLYMWYGPENVRINIKIWLVLEICLNHSCTAPTLQGNSNLRTFKGPFKTQVAIFCRPKLSFVGKNCLCQTFCKNLLVCFVLIGCVQITKTTAIILWLELKFQEFNTDSSVFPKCPIVPMLLKCLKVDLLGCIHTLCQRLFSLWRTFYTPFFFIECRLLLSWCPQEVFSYLLNQSCKSCESLPTNTATVSIVNKHL